MTTELKPSATGAASSEPSVSPPSALVGLPSAASAEPGPETTTIRLVHDPEYAALCYAPVCVAEDLLRSEGFTDVRLVKLIDGSEARTVAAGQADVSGARAVTLVLAIEARQALTALVGLHLGCLEIVGTGTLRTIRDLEDRTVAVSALGSDDHVFW